MANTRDFARAITAHYKTLEAEHGKPFGGLSVDTNTGKITIECVSVPVALLQGLADALKSDDAFDADVDVDEDEADPDAKPKTSGRADKDGWSVTSKGNAKIHKHPQAFEGRAVVSNHNGVFYNGHPYIDLKSAKAAALAHLSGDSCPSCGHSDSSYHAPSVPYCADEWHGKASVRNA